MRFELTQKEVEKAQAFIEECSKQLIEEQRKTMSEKEFSFLTLDGKYPYLGAIGGGATYSFTPTSIGIFCSVKFLDKELTLTDFSTF